MKVLVVSGIWPPDVGGPATHAPEVAQGLAGRGHEVEVITTAWSPPDDAPYPVRWIRRSLPPGVRHAAVAALVAARSRSVDVVYAASMIGRSSFAARAPLVVKVSGDVAYERAFRRGLYDGDLLSFQSARLDLRAELLRRWRTLTARRAALLLAPSEFLRRIVIGWGIEPGRVGLLPNTAPRVTALPARDELRAAFGVDGEVLGFAGRLTRAKGLPILSSALAQLPGVTLLAAGDGEERDALVGANVRRLGAQPRDRVLELLAAADAAILSSAWENFPHVLVEALAVGTPVIATEVGGVPEIVADGENGLLVPPNDPDALAAAVRRFFDDTDLRARLQAGAAPSAARFAPAAVLDALEAALLRATRPYPSTT